MQRIHPAKTRFVLGILKNKQAVEPVSIPTPISRSANNEDSNEMEVDAEVETSNNTLPEGFFDDPVMDAKVIFFIVLGNFEFQSMKYSFLELLTITI